MTPTPVRVRFAPSPTGYLHVGGARTALFNWLYARKTGGTFVLRIEDTDKERSTDAHTQVILEGLRWLGVDWDEGPYFQGAEGARHRADAERLLANGLAYRCFATAEELDAERRIAVAAGRPYRYDRARWRLTAEDEARRMTAGDPFVIRFAVPDAELAWEDAVHGRISFQGRDLDDFVILRSDGSAIYNLAVVSDDIDMRITHVMRGDDHVSNTPKQIALYQALGAPLPVFAHVPMILGTDGKKLSKRHGATAVGDYQDQGILPSAMRNFLALLGWSPGGDREVLTGEEMIDFFSLDAIQGKPAVFDTAKLEWMNGQYLSHTPADDLLAPVMRQLARMGVDPKERELRTLIDAAKARSRTVLQLAEQVAAAARRKPHRDRREGGEAAEENGPGVRSQPGAGGRGAGIPQCFGLEQRPPARGAQGRGEANGVKLGDAMQPVRVALTGGTVSEPVNELLAVVGRDESLSRIRAALARARDTAQA
jgi:glutamyl-tRNA synthetase